MLQNDIITSRDNTLEVFFYAKRIYIFKNYFNLFSTNFTNVDMPGIMGVKKIINIKITLDVLTYICYT